METPRNPNPSPITLTLDEAYQLNRKVKAFRELYNREPCVRVAGVFQLPDLAKTYDSKGEFIEVTKIQPPYIQLPLMGPSGLVIFPVWAEPLLPNPYKVQLF